MGIKLNTERNKMDYYNIEAFDATGLVKTVFTSKGHGCWLSNSEEDIAATARCSATLA